MDFHVKSNIEWFFLSATFMKWEKSTPSHMLYGRVLLSRKRMKRCRINALKSVYCWNQNEVSVLSVFWRYASSIRAVLFGLCFLVWHVSDVNRVLWQRIRWIVHILVHVWAGNSQHRSVVWKTEAEKQFPKDGSAFENTCTLLIKCTLVQTVATLMDHYACITKMCTLIYATAKLK